MPPRSFARTPGLGLCFSQQTNPKKTIYRSRSNKERVLSSAERTSLPGDDNQGASSTRAQSTRPREAIFESRSNILPFEDFHRRKTSPYRVYYADDRGMLANDEFREVLLHNLKPARSFSSSSSIHSQVPYKETFDRGKTGLNRAGSRDGSWILIFSIMGRYKLNEPPDQASAQFINHLLFLHPLLKTTRHLVAAKTSSSSTTRQSQKEGKTFLFLSWTLVVSISHLILNLGPPSPSAHPDRPANPRDALGSPDLNPNSASPFLKPNG